MLVTVFVCAGSIPLSSTNSSSASQVDFVPPPSAVAVDTDGDSLYEEVRVGVTLNVSLPDWYGVVGLLYTEHTRWTSQVWAANYSYREVGLNSTVLIFDSIWMWAYGLNGSFSVNVEVRRDPSLVLASATWTLGSFNISDFDGRSADHLTGLCNDSGLDTDDDGLFEYLVISAQVNVSSGQYVLEGRAMGVMDNSTEPIKATFDVDSGTQMLDIRFDGEMLMNADSDGPYLVWLVLKRGPYELVSSEEYVTNAYFKGQFSPSVDAILEQPHEDAAVDMNGDGASEYLAVIVNVTVKVAGTYNVTGTLSAFVGILEESWNNTYLEVGQGQVTLLFSGAPIRAAEWNGTYWIVIQLLNKNGDWLQTSAHVTSYYSWVNFAKPPVAAVTAHQVANDGGMSYALNASVSTVDARFFEVRWDFDGDGVWDTDWSSIPVVVYEFPEPGNYTVIVEIRDARGLTNVSRVLVTVLPDQHPGLVATDYLPFAVVLLPILLLSVGAVVLFFAWPVESLLIALFMMLLPLYTRLRRDDVLENYRRGMIHGFVLAHPGVSFTEMKEALSISSGSLVYHLSVLQDKGQVCCRKSGTYMRYYINGSPISEILRLGLTAFQMEILRHIHSKGEASANDIRRTVTASRQTLHYNLKKLLTDGILSASLSKGHRVYRIASGAESDLKSALGVAEVSEEPATGLASRPSES